MCAVRRRQIDRLRLDILSPGHASLRHYVIVAVIARAVRRRQVDWLRLDIRQPGVCQEVRAQVQACAGVFLLLLLLFRAGSGPFILGLALQASLELGVEIGLGVLLHHPGQVLILHFKGRVSPRFSRA